MFRETVQESMASMGLFVQGAASQAFEAGIGFILINFDRDSGTLGAEVYKGSL